MAPFVDAGLFEPVTDLWAGARASTKIWRRSSQQCLVMVRSGVFPYSYYQWGVYYRKDLFDLLKIEEPKTWDELLSRSLCV